MADSTAAINRVLASLKENYVRGVLGDWWFGTAAIMVVLAFIDLAFLPYVSPLK